MIARVLIAGGGTGGHLFPGIAVVEELRRRLPELEVLFVGTERGIEARVLGELGEEFRVIDVKPLVGRAGGELARSLLALPRSGLQAINIVRSFRPDLALGLGGYAAGPLLLAAAALRVRTALLQPDVHVGLTNRLLAKAVERAYLAFDEAAPWFGSERARVLGNPVRRAFVEAARMAGHDPAGVAARARTVLVMGGSQGAQKLNQLVPDALARAGVAELGVTVVHQTGSAMAAEVERRYRELGVQAEVLPFIDDAARAYLGASLVIARAGAGTLAELCAIGRASILVPLPATGPRQLDNALALERSGAALALPESELSVAGLAGHVRALLTDAKRRGAMAEAARRRGRPDAAAAIVDDLFAWLGVPSQGAPVTRTDPEDKDGSTGDAGADAGPASSAPIRRKPKVKSAQLRLRPVAAPIDAVQ
jgi:UDP-N-acetylglucosamine--N-acetylmuramyl-(pentapeptide) pyrophosphoryl-undecaprenol N-acetylglucosamine transferase